MESGASPVRPSNLMHVHERSEAASNSLPFLGSERTEIYEKGLSPNSEQQDGISTECERGPLANDHGYSGDSRHGVEVYETNDWRAPLIELSKKVLPELPYPERWGTSAEYCEYWTNVVNDEKLRLWEHELVHANFHRKDVSSDEVRAKKADVTFDTVQTQKGKQIVASFPEKPPTGNDGAMVIVKFLAGEPLVGYAGKSKYYVFDNDEPVIEALANGTPTPVQYVHVNSRWAHEHHLALKALEQIDKWPTRSVIVDPSNRVQRADQEEQQTLVSHYTSSMNQSQKDVLDRISNLRPREVCLVLGPGGSGKTFVAVQSVISYLLDNAEARVLVVASTNKAVENMLLEAEARGIPSLRLVSKAKREEPGFQPCKADLEVVFDQMCQKLSHQEPFKNYIEGPNRERERACTRYLLGLAKLVGCTSASTERLSGGCGGKFSLTLYDEAAIARESSVITVLPRTLRLALLGDPYQNDPFNRDPRSSVSMFRRMMQAGHPYTLLDTQMRMGPELSEFLNYAVYGGRVKDGPRKPCWTLINPDTKQRHYSLVVVVPHTDKTSQKLVSSEEARAVNWTILNYLDTSTPDTADNSPLTSDIGCIVPFREQELLVQQSIQTSIQRLTTAGSDQRVSQLPGGDRRIEVSTVDRFQGDQRDIMLISLVKKRNNTVWQQHCVWNRTCSALGRARDVRLVFTDPTQWRQETPWMHFIQFEARRGRLMTWDDFTKLRFVQLRKSRAEQGYTEQDAVSNLVKYALDPHVWTKAVRKPHPHEKKLFHSTPDRNLDESVNNPPYERTECPSMPSARQVAPGVERTRNPPRVASGQWIGGEDGNDLKEMDSSSSELLEITTSFSHSDCRDLSDNSSDASSLSAYSLQNDVASCFHSTHRGRFVSMCTTRTIAFPKNRKRVVHVLAHVKRQGRLREPETLEEWYDTSQKASQDFQFPSVLAFEFESDDDAEGQGDTSSFHAIENKPDLKDRVADDGRFQRTNEQMDNSAGSSANAQQKVFDNIMPPQCAQIESTAVDESIATDACGLDDQVRARAMRILRPFERPWHSREFGRVMAVGWLNADKLSCLGIELSKWALELSWLGGSGVVELKHPGLFFHRLCNVNEAGKLTWKLSPRESRPNKRVVWRCHAGYVSDIWSPDEPVTPQRVSLAKSISISCNSACVCKASAASALTAAEPPPPPPGPPPLRKPTGLEAPPPPPPPPPLPSPAQCFDSSQIPGLALRPPPVTRPRNSREPLNSAVFLVDGICAKSGCEFPRGINGGGTHCCYRCRAADISGVDRLHLDPKSGERWKAAHGPACTKHQSLNWCTNTQF